LSSYFPKLQSTT